MNLSKNKYITCSVVEKTMQSYKKVIEMVIDAKSHSDLLWIIDLDYSNYSSGICLALKQNIDSVDILKTHVDYDEIKHEIYNAAVYANKAFNVYNHLFPSFRTLTELECKRLRFNETTLALAKKAIIEESLEPRFELLKKILENHYKSL